MNFLFLETVGYESALRLSGHHYARLLVRRGHRVVSVSTPVTPLHRFARRDAESVARRIEHHRRGIFEAPGGVLHYVPAAPFPVRKFFPFDRLSMLRLAFARYRGNLLKRFSEIDFTPDVISIQNPLFHPALKCFPNAVVQYRMTDLMEAFARYPGSMLECESRLLDEADLVSITSKQFAHKLKGPNEAKMIYAPNGVDVEHFSRPHPRPAEYGANERPIAVYVGALREWFDWDLLKTAAREAPEIRFFIISPDAPRQDLAALENFRYIPGVAYEDVPAYYQHAAVCVIPFRMSDLVAPVNPIKMYESLAAGTPVVAPAWEELRRLEAPVALAKDGKDFARLIKDQASGAQSRDYADFLAKHSWDANLDVLLKRIEQAQSAR